MGWWAHLCVCGLVWLHLSCLMETSKKIDEGMRMAIDDLLNRTNEFCIRYQQDEGSQFCVQIHEERTSWYEAQAICRDWVGHLPELQHQTEREVVNVGSIVIQKLQWEGMWLGGRTHTKDVHPQHPSMPQHSRYPPFRRTQHLHSGIYCGQPGEGSAPDPNRHIPPKKCEQIKCGVVGLINDELQWGNCSCFGPEHFICLSNDKHTDYCPDGFKMCTEASVCFKVYPYSRQNWFRSNQMCRWELGRFLNPHVESEEYLLSVLECVQETVMGSNEKNGNAEPIDIKTWTTYNEAWWTWNSTGEVIGMTRWAPEEPSCPLKECLQVTANNEWSTEYCHEDRNFICVKRNGTCEDCILGIYGDSSKEVSLDEPSGTPGSRDVQPDGNITIDKWLVVGILSAFLLIVAVAIILVIYMIRRYKKKTEVLEMTSQARLQESTYQHLGHRNSIYENDGADFDMYMDLNMQQNGKNYYTTIAEIGSQEPGETLAKPNYDDILQRHGPRKGSLPATPDVVPERIQRNPSPTSEYYLEVIPGPYEGLKPAENANPANDAKGCMDKDEDDDAVPDPSLPENTEDDIQPIDGECYCDVRDYNIKPAQMEDDRGEDPEDETSRVRSLDEESIKDETTSDEKQIKHVEVP